MHNTRTLPPFARLGLIAAAALLASGCSVLQEEKIDYKSAKQTSTLDIPPDLTQLSKPGTPGSILGIRPYTNLIQPFPLQVLKDIGTGVDFCARSDRAEAVHTDLGRIRGRSRDRLPGCFHPVSVGFQGILDDRPEKTGCLSEIIHLGAGRHARNQRHGYDKLLLHCIDF